MCQGNKKCKACAIAGIFNNNKMKKKLSFKGIGSNLIGGASGAGMKMGINAIISVVDKNGALVGIKKDLVSLGAPIVGSVLMPKVFNKPMVKDAVIGFNAITIFDMALNSGVLPENIAARVSGYDPYALAGYKPYSLAGGNPNLPFNSKNQNPKNQNLG